MTKKSKHGTVQNKFVIDQNSKTVLANKTLLLDTNALVDAYRLPVEFGELMDEILSFNCDITTTRSILTEFLGGTTDTQILKEKVELIEIIFGKKIDNESLYLPLNTRTPPLEDFLFFSRQAKNFSIVDFEIYRTMKKYKTHLLLVSRNHKDFSTKLTERVSFITLLGTSEIHTYGVYRAL